MDIKSLDPRESFEAGVFCPIHHFQTREPFLDDAGEPAGFMVRAHASKTATEKLAKIRPLLNKEVKTDSDLHVAQVQTAMCYIIEARGLRWGPEEIGANKTIIREMLDISKPEMRAREDDEIVDGESTGLALLNDPFAYQVIRWAKRQDHYLGKK